MHRLLLCLTIIAASAPAVAQEQEFETWSLRNHYTFTVGTGRVYYDEANARWTVLDVKDTPLLEELRFQIELADGEAITNNELPRGESHRTPYKGDDAFGGGTVYSVEFPPHEGLQVVHRVTTYKQWPFVLISLALKNTGTAPISLSSVSPIYIPDLDVDAVSLREWERAAVAEGEDATAMMVISAPARDLNLALAVLPAKEAKTFVDLRLSERTLRGEAGMRLTAPKALQPGETFNTEPVWVSYGLEEPSRIEEYFTYYFRTLMPPPTSNAKMGAWLPETQADSGYSVQVESEPLAP